MLLALQLKISGVYVSLYAQALLNKSKVCIRARKVVLRVDTRKSS